MGSVVSTHDREGISYPRDLFTTRQRAAISGGIRYPREETVNNIYPTQLQVTPDDVGQPVDRILRRGLKADPPHVRKLFRQKRVHFRADAEAEPRLLQVGDVLELPGVLAIEAREGKPPPAPNRKIRPRVLFENASIVVLDKPAGLTVHPGPWHGSDTLLNGLVASYPELPGLGTAFNYGLVHRLDRETSGLMVVARTQEAHTQLVEQFRNQEVEKRYVAIVLADPVCPRDETIEATISGQAAITRIQVKEVAGSVAMLHLFPKTGRTHQIRIHLAGRRTPVLCDSKYGKGRDELTAKLYAKRLLLHAEHLAFRDPETGESLAFDREPPRDLRRSWRRAQRFFSQKDGKADTP